MKLTIFSATGGVGRHVLEQAQTAGHQVTAAVRSPTKLPPDTKSVRVDLAAPDGRALQEAVRGADAVLSCLGRRTSADSGITSRGTRAIVEAMQAVGTRRLIVISASPVSTTPSPGRPHPPRMDPGEGPLQRYLLTPLIKLVLARTVYLDLARMEDILRASDLDWTIIRPPRLTNGPPTGVYRTAFGQNLRRGLSISRADLADFMLRALDQPSTVRQAVGIAY